MKSWLLSLATITLASILGGAVGFALGSLLFAKFIPPWQIYTIKVPPVHVNEIPSVAINSTMEDPTGDIIYAKSANGELFSYTLFQENWLAIGDIPKNDFVFPKCATDWSDHPPVEHGIVDSIGVRFERPLSTILRCYVLSENGTLHVWIRETDLLSLITVVLGTTIVGIAFGCITEIFLIIHRKRRAKIPT